ncbi:MAG: hypothetical protein O2960_30730 [Verrucomicrobia bacterium]|nr:hypothetical protein [Verrucomicrobiota bacterium]
MRIERISARPVAIPYKTPWRNRHTEESGAPMTHLRTVVIEVHTDTGSTGLGEFRGDSLDGQQARRLDDLLIGADPTNISRLVPLLEENIGASGIVAAIDFALHDIKGKAFGVPVYQLLGGKHREKVPLV